MSIRKLTLSLTLLALSAPAFAQDPIEGVQKKLAAAAERIKSLYMKMEMNQDMSFEGGSSKTTGTGVLEILKAGDKPLFRFEMTGKSVNKFGDQEMTQENTSTTIGDGEFVYTVMDAAGQKMAMKNKYDPSYNMADFQAQWEQMSKDHTLKLLPEEEINGRECFVIEATPKNANTGMSKMVYYYAKDLGVVMKTVAYNEKGEAMMTATVTELKIDPEISKERFEFKAPEGVEVQDMTQMITEQP